VGGWLREWIETRHGLAPSTLKSYREHILLHLEPGLGLIPLAELDTHDLVVFYPGPREARHGPRPAPPLSAATIERVNATLRAALNAARRQGLITRNPGHRDRPAPWAPSGGGGVDRRPDRAWTRHGLGHHFRLFAAANMRCCQAIRVSAGVR